MWAAFKSDLKEFATGAAEETNVVAERVVGTRIIRAGGGNADSAGVGGGGDDYDHDDAADGGSRAAGGGAAAGGIAVPGATAVLSSIGERGLRGLTSVSSMMGGIVAPRPAHPPAAAAAPPAPPGSSLSSMLAAVAYGEDEGEEEEMGWSDDDDEDLDAVEDDDGAAAPGAGSKTTKTAGGPNDFFEEELGPDPPDASEDSAVGGAVPGGAPPAVVAGAAASPGATTTTTPADDDREALRALRSKLEEVERSRSELQLEHRRQTAELVELRSKVEEMERQRWGHGGGEIPRSSDEGRGGGDGDGEEVRTLRLLVEDLKLQLNEKIKSLDQEHEELVGSILREKEGLDRELIEQRRRNEELAGENRALLERGGGVEDLLRGYQRQIHDLEDELASLRANLGSASPELRGEMERQSARADRPEESLARTMEDRERAIWEVEESKTRLTEVEGRVRTAGTELDMRTAEFEERSRVEVVGGAGTSKSQESSSSSAAAFAPALAAAATALAVSADETASEDVEAPLPAADDLSKESPRVSDVLDEKAPRPPSSSSGSSPEKVEVEDELSDDWGDGGWGDDV
jgi:hypothetical protein